ncbi:MAG TPA: OmpH family outer membrane protein [Chitinophagaceae bacterium]|nr:OmpH family outer membrane protein [Chitinophagaceae bacterium]
MKSGTIIFNALVLVLIAVLFYLHFSPKSAGKTTVAQQGAVTKNAPSTIAYFEMDSLESSFAMVKDVQKELSKEEEAIMSEKARLEKMYRDKYTNYQNQQSMSQVQSENAAKDLQQTQKQIESNLMALDQRYQDLKMRKMTEVKTKIEEFLKTYNQSKGYSYIFANEPGFFYFRDTAYDITGDVIKGLNEAYTKKK